MSESFWYKINISVRAAFLSAAEFIDAPLVENKTDPTRWADGCKSQPNFKETPEFQVFDQQIWWRLIVKWIFQCPTRYKIDR